MTGMDAQVAFLDDPQIPASPDELREIIKKLMRKKCTALQNLAMRIRLFIALAVIASIGAAVAFEYAYICGMLKSSYAAILSAAALVAGFYGIKYLHRALKGTFICHHEIAECLYRGFEIPQEILDDFNRGKSITLKIGQFEDLTISKGRAGACHE